MILLNFFSQCINVKSEAENLKQFPLGTLGSVIPNLITFDIKYKIESEIHRSYDYINLKEDSLENKLNQSGWPNKILDLHFYFKKTNIEGIVNTFFKIINEFKVFYSSSKEWTAYFKMIETNLVPSLKKLILSFNKLKKEYNVFMYLFDSILDRNSLGNLNK